MGLRMLRPDRYLSRHKLLASVAKQPEMNPQNLHGSDRGEMTLLCLPLDLHIHAHNKLFNSKFKKNGRLSGRFRGIFHYYQRTKWNILKE